ncbi:Myb/SANT-like DNA-binding domain, partial [Phytophthora infestans]
PIRLDLLSTPSTQYAVISPPETQRHFNRKVMRRRPSGLYQRRPVQTSESGSSRTSQPRDPSTETGVSQPVSEGVSGEPFAWTTRAADALLRVRFESMAYRFGGAKSSSQLRAAWIMVAAEVSRLGGIVVSPTQCKSKIKYMQKQYTEYRVDQRDTGNRTEIPLREPASYGTMCEVWGNMTGMQSEAFYSSDTRLQQQPAPDSTAENAADNTGDTEG